MIQPQQKKERCYTDYARCKNCKYLENNFGQLSCSGKSNAKLVKIESEMSTCAMFDLKDERLQYERCFDCYGYNRKKNVCMVRSSDDGGYLPLAKDSIGCEQWVERPKDNSDCDTDGWVQLPQMGSILITDFISDISDALTGCKTLFYRKEDDNVVEYSGGMLTIVKPNRMISLIEDYVIPYMYVKNEKVKDAFVRKKKSASKQQMEILLCSPKFKSNLPEIRHTIPVPIPFVKDNKLWLPRPGYNSELHLFIPNDAPIVPEDVPLEEAKEYLLDIHNEFCFKSPHDKIKAVMGVLTPFLRGLYDEWTIRTPVFIYFANRERAGKDYLAGIRSIIYTGFATEESPISTGGRNGNNNEELRKKIMSTILSGRSLMHFSNNKGHINNSVFEQIITARKFRDRLLGGNKIAEVDNALEFSLSGNIGTTPTADLANRSIIIELFLKIENANDRSFNTPTLHESITRKREYALGCLYTLVKDWFDNGRKLSEVMFSSFPVWAGICGGIIENVGLENPLTIKTDNIISVDTETGDMKELFEICQSQEWMIESHLAEHCPGFSSNCNSYNRAMLMDICSSFNLFEHIDLNDRSGKTKFGILLNKFEGRELSGVVMKVDKTQKRASRRRMFFEKVSA